MSVIMGINDATGTSTAPQGDLWRVISGDVATHIGCLLWTGLSLAGWQKSLHPSVPEQRLLTLNSTTITESHLRNMRCTNDSVVGRRGAALLWKPAGWSRTSRASCTCRRVPGGRPDGGCATDQQGICFRRRDWRVPCCRGGGEGRRGSGARDREGARVAGLVGFVSLKALLGRNGRSSVKLMSQFMSALYVVAGER